MTPKQRRVAGSRSQIESDIAEATAAPRSDGRPDDSRHASGRLDAADHPRTKRGRGDDRRSGG